MIKVRLTNTSVVDIMVDKMGNNDVKDKILVHPRMSTTVEIAKTQLPVLRKVKRLVVVVVA